MTPESTHGTLMNTRSLLHPARYSDESYPEYRLRRSQAKAETKTYLKGRVIRPSLKKGTSK